MAKRARPFHSWTVPCEPSQVAYGGLTCQLDNQNLAKISWLGLSWSKDTEQVGQVYRFVSTLLKTIGLRRYLPVHFKGLLTRWPVLINVITLCPFYSMFQIKNLDWEHVPFLYCLLTEQLCPGHILASAEPGKLILSCLSQGNLVQIDLGALKSTAEVRKRRMGNPMELQQRGIQAGTSRSLFLWCDPGWVFTSQRAAVSCAVGSIKQVIFTTYSML